MPQLFVVLRFVTLAVHPACVPVPICGVARVLPVVVQNATEPAVGGLVQATTVLYFTESAKYASSAVTRLRRSDFIEAMYAFSFVFANFGIAMAARMPIITTTISSSIRVKPLRLIQLPPVRIMIDVTKTTNAAPGESKGRASPGNCALST